MSRESSSAAPNHSGDTGNPLVVPASGLFSRTAPSPAFLSAPLPAKLSRSTLLASAIEPFDGSNDILKGRTKLFKFVVPPGISANELPSAVRLGDRMEFYLPMSHVYLSFRCADSFDAMAEIPLRSHGRDRHAMTCPSGLHVQSPRTALVRLGPDDARLRYVLCNSGVEMYILWERVEPTPPAAGAPGGAASVSTTPSGSATASSANAGSAVASFASSRAPPLAHNTHSHCHLTLRGRNFVATIDKAFKNPSMLCKCCYRDASAKGSSVSVG
jgi:hypothetical protein